MNARWAIGLFVVCGCADDGGTDSGGGTESMTTAMTMSSSGSETGSGSGSGSGSGTTQGESSTTEMGSSEGSTSASSSSGSTSTGDTATMGSETSGMCANENESCAQGEMCCGQLTCCVGQPVPPGMEYCGADCPDSDRNLKENFAAIDPQDVLTRVAQLPITTWTYKDDPAGARHLGPMAQDFKEAFDLGASDRAIHKIDADGVALAAIQALHAENAELRARLEALEARLATK